MPAIGSVGLALLDLLLADLLLLEPALLNLLDLLGADRALDTGRAFNPLSFEPLGSRALDALAFDPLRSRSLDTLAFDPLRCGALGSLALDPLRSRSLDALAFDPLRNGALDALAFDSLRSGALSFDSLPRLGALCTNTLAGLRTLGAHSLLAALGGLRAGRGALRALLGAIRLLGSLLGLGAVATLGVRGSGDCERRHGGDQECLGHEDFQYRPVAIRTLRKSA